MTQRQAVTMKKALAYPECRPGRQEPDTDGAGRADRVASRLRPGRTSGGVDVQGSQAQGGVGADLWARGDEGAGEVLGGAAGSGGQAPRANVGRAGAVVTPRQRAQPHRR